MRVGTVLMLVLLVAMFVAAAAQEERALVGVDSSESVVRRMSVRQLRTFLRDRDASCAGCVERDHLVQRALQVRQSPTADDLIAEQLALMQHSAVTHMSLHHLTADVPELPDGQVPLVEAPPVPDGLVVVGDVVCEKPLVNGTQYCHSIAALRAHATAV